MKESNILLAKFLGLEFEEGQDRLSIQGLGTQLIEDTFNKKWDWLMQVVEKIESLGFESKINNDTIFNSCVFLNKPNIKVPINIGYISECTKIEAVYNACVEFVEWWNKNK